MVFSPYTGVLLCEKINFWEVFMKKIKLRGARNFILGFLTCAILFSLAITVFAARPDVRWTEIRVGYGDYKVYVDGLLFEARHGNTLLEPFVHNGWIYAPFEHIAKALGKDAYWDGATHSLYLGRRTPAGVATPFLRTAPAYDVSDQNNVKIEDTVQMGGSQYSNAIIYQAYANHPHHSLHNLNGQYTRVTGYIGRVDGTAQYGVTFNFIADGNVIASYELNALDLPQRITLNVHGVRNLRIQVVTEHWASPSYAFANAIIE
jgi:hypothetical protein